MIDESLTLALAFLKAHPTWYIFPIKRLEKFPPLVKDDLNIASNDPKQIAIWGKWYGCNWGLALKKSGLVVMDMDTKPGKFGQKTFDNLTLEHGDLPPTFTVRSPSGGKHSYFQGEHTYAQGKGGFGVDIDSPNYVLIPGCWLCTNVDRGYEIIDDLPVAPVPDWFKIYLKNKDDKIADAADADPAVDLDQDVNTLRMIKYLQEGAPKSIAGQNGEKALFDVAAVLKDNGISEYNAIEIHKTHYNVPGRCDPLWSVGEGPIEDRLDVKIHNAWLYATQTQPGSATAEFAFGGPGDVFEGAEVESVAALNEVWKALIEAQKPARLAKLKKLAGDNGVVEPNDPIEPPPAGKVDDSVDDSDFLGDDPVDDNDPLGDDGDVPTASVDDDRPTPDDPEVAPEAPRKTTGGKTLEDVRAEWVWVVGLERFVRVSDSKMWKAKQFDSRYNHFCDKASVSAMLFKQVFLRPEFSETEVDKEGNRKMTKPGQGIQRFDDAISRPGWGQIIPPNFNLWRPSPIIPKEGDTNLWNEHLNYLFQNPEDKDHVLNWMAWVYQNQRKKPNHALLIVGKNTGTGKSFIARVFEQLIGASNTQRPKNSSLKGDFNGWALRCKLVLIEELMQIGRREVANELRDMITEPTVEVNIKNVPAQLVENYMAMMGISNHPDALPIDETDRRWLVVSTPVSRREPEYYDKLFKMIDPPNMDALGAIAYELQNRKLGKYSAATNAPYTDAKREMIELSRSDTEAWLYDNMVNPPMSYRLTTIRDVIETMPATMQRGQRLNTTVQNFLRDRVRGEALDQVRLKNDSKVRLWALNGKAALLRNMTPEALAEMYENERKSGTSARSSDDQAMSDFGEEAD